MTVFFFLPTKANNTQNAEHNRVVKRPQKSIAKFEFGDFYEVEDGRNSLWRLFAS